MSRLRIVGRVTGALPTNGMTAPVLEFNSDRSVSGLSAVTNTTEPQFWFEIEPEDMIAGNVIRVYDSTALIKTYTLTQDHIWDNTLAAGTVTVADGAHSYTATIGDAGTQSVASNVVAWTKTTDERTAPSLALAPGFDSGAQGDDSTSRTAPKIRFTMTDAQVGDTVFLIDKADNDTLLGSHTLIGGETSTYDLQSSTLAVGAQSVAGYIRTSTNGFSSETAYAFTVNALDPLIAGTPVTAAFKDIAYGGFTVSATGGSAPYTYAVVSGALPAGITLNASTGLVSGTPTVNGVSSGIVIRVTDSVFRTDQLVEFDLTVTDYEFTNAFTSAELGLFIDPSDLSTLFNTITGTGAVSVAGTAVGTVNDKSGNAFHLTATGNDTTRPTYETTDYPHLNFDGSNDKLRRLASLGMRDAGACTIALAIKGNPDSTSILISEGYSVNTTPFYMIQANTSAATAGAFHHRTDGGVLNANNLGSGTGAWDNTWRVVVIVDSGSNVKWYVDGVEVDSDNYTRSGLWQLVNRFALGCQFLQDSTNHFFVAKIRKLAIIKRAATAAERAAMTTHLGNLIGKTL
jgi:hypothetical protein